MRSIALGALFLCLPLAAAAQTRSLASELNENYLRPTNFRSPDWREVGIGDPSQDHPICGVKQADGTFHFYRCGVVHDSMEPYRTVWIYSGEKPYQLTHHVANSSFIAMNSVALATAILDPYLSQRCIHAGTCKEGNPIYGKSAARGYSISLGTFAFGFYMAYRQRSYDLRRRQAGISPEINTRFAKWWVPAVATSIAHGVGMAFGLAAGGHH